VKMQRRVCMHVTARFVYRTFAIVVYLIF